MDKRTPVLVGVGQTVSHWDGTSGPDGAPSYLSLAAQAAKNALRDTGAASVLAAEIDTIAMVRTMADSIPSFDQVFGRCQNLPRGVAKEIGADPRDAIYASVGGQSPQSLINEMASAIYQGERDVVLIGGSEALGAMKAAKRAGISLDWNAEIDGTLEDRGLGSLLLNRAEIKHGLVVPAYFYALFETAYAHDQGHSCSAHRRAMSALFAPFSETASNNPYAQFKAARTTDFLATPSKENYAFADPYLKWHMAQDAVNMAAAVVMMSSEKADALGIDPAKRVYLHGSGEAQDDYISSRPDLTGSWAMRTALGRALEQAEKDSADLSVLDLYSCFPIAVFSSTAALGIDWETDKRGFTQTGGLPFFGGPGNNYSLHGIASTVERLRGDPGAFGLVLANGGWMSKEAAGIYSTAPCREFTIVEEAAQPTAQIALDMEPAGGVLETYTRVHGRSGPSKAIAFGRTDTGKRFIAVSRDAETLTHLGRDELAIGAPMSVTSEAEVNTFKLA